MDTKERKPSSGYGKKLVKAGIIGLVFGLVAGIGFQSVGYIKQRFFDQDVQEKEATLLSKKGELDATATSSAVTITDVSDIVDNVMPAVVAVTNVTITEYHSFFGRSESYESETSGSGIIISQDDHSLYIATNNHVVSGAESTTITFANEKAVPATLKGTDPATDLAVVSVALSEIDSETLAAIKVATVGDSKNLEVGESAVVIGNALGYGQSVTTGVVSAVNREVQLQDENGAVITNYLIQTDAAVNPGNSGGAMLNMNGEVIGIVSAKYSDTQVEGMGYAIPISYASSILEGLINNEIVPEGEKSYLGIAGVDINAVMAEQYNMPIGVYVSQTISGSAAEKAGIEKEDVITSFAGRNVSSMAQIQSIMNYLPAGSKVEIEVAKADKDYKETTVTVTLGKK